MMMTTTMTRNNMNMNINTFQMDYRKGKRTRGGRRKNGKNVWSG